MAEYESLDQEVRGEVCYPDWNERPQLINGSRDDIIVCLVQINRRIIFCGNSSEKSRIDIGDLFGTSRFVLSLLRNFHQRWYRDGPPSFSLVAHDLEWLQKFHHVTS